MKIDISYLDLKKVSQRRGESFSTQVRSEYNSRTSWFCPPQYPLRCLRRLAVCKYHLMYLKTQPLSLPWSKRKHADSWLENSVQQLHCPTVGISVQDNQVLVSLSWFTTPCKDTSPAVTKAVAMQLGWEWDSSSWISDICLFNSHTYFVDTTYQLYLALFIFENRHFAFGIPYGLWEATS